MKILLTHELFPPDFGGGGEYVVLETARRLIERGVEARVLTTGNPSITAHEGVPTIRLPIHRYRFNLAVRSIRDLAREVDLIHTFNYHACLPALIAGRRLGKPVICQVLGFFGDAWRHMRGAIGGRLWQWWERFLLTRRYDRLIFPSDYSLESGIALGVRPDRSLANSPGIDLGAYGPAPRKEDIVLFVGKLDVRKGVDDVLATAGAMPDVRFRVVGWGPEEAKLKQSAPPNVEFPGFERGAPLREEYARARIFLLPSHAETFGIALVEAMASGCAVISTVPLEFEGLRVKAGDRDAIRAAVRKLWDDRTETARMGRRNLELAQSHGWDRYMDALQVVYGQVLENHQRSETTRSG